MPRQNCNSMAVFAVTVYSVFTMQSGSMSIQFNIKYFMLYTIVVEQHLDRIICLEHGSVK